MLCDGWENQGGGQNWAEAGPGIRRGWGLRQLEAFATGCAALPPLLTLLMLTWLIAIWRSPPTAAVISPFHHLYLLHNILSSPSDLVILRGWRHQGPRAAAAQLTHHHLKVTVPTPPFQDHLNISVNQAPFSTLMLPFSPSGSCPSMLEWSWLFDWLACPLPTVSLVINQRHSPTISGQNNYFCAPDIFDFSVAQPPAPLILLFRAPQALIWWCDAMSSCSPCPPPPGLFESIFAQIWVSLLWIAQWHRAVLWHHLLLNFRRSCVLGFGSRSSSHSWSSLHGGLSWVASLTGKMS